MRLILHQDQVEISGEIPIGLSFDQAAKRVGSHNLWEVNTIYCVSIKIPKYLQNRSQKLGEELLKQLTEQREFLGAYGTLLLRVEEQKVFIFLYLENEVYEKEVGFSFQKSAIAEWRRIKRPYYTIWLEGRRQKRQLAIEPSTYIKASKLTDEVDG